MNNKNKKILALGLCSIMCITNVGCSSLGKKESKKKVETNVDLSNIKDIRTVKVNQDQAMLRFTTQNKAGSISSLILKEKDGKYIYSIDGIDKKGQGIIMTVDAKTSDVISSKPIVAASAEKKVNVLNFSIIKDLKLAIQAAFKNVDRDVYSQIDSYKLMYANNKNIYKFTFSNGETEKEKSKKKTVYIDASSLKAIGKEEESQIRSFEESLNNPTPTSNDKASATNSQDGSGKVTKSTN